LTIFTAQALGGSHGIRNISDDDVVLDCCCCCCILALVVVSLRGGRVPRPRARLSLAHPSAMPWFLEGSVACKPGEFLDSFGAGFGSDCLLMRDNHGANVSQRSDWFCLGAETTAGRATLCVLSNTSAKTKACLATEMAFFRRNAPCGYLLSLLLFGPSWKATMTTAAAVDRSMPTRRASRGNEEEYQCFCDVIMSLLCTADQNKGGFRASHLEKERQHSKTMTLF